jgi:hydroxypyruvate isomerase
MHNLPAGDWDGGERGIACLPDRVDEFRSGVERALGYAECLGVRRLNCLAGVAPAGADPRLLLETLSGNLGWAADVLGRRGMRLLLEPLNDRDVPGFLVTRSAQAIAILDGVGRDNLFLQYDIYHMQRMEGDLAATLERLLPRIGHLQLADNPGRHEPGSGEIDFRFLLGHLRRIGWRDWIGCEYLPRGDTAAGLAWMREIVDAAA